MALAGHLLGGSRYSNTINFLILTLYNITSLLQDVILGLNSLFTDLLNFEDPLNLEAAQHYERDKVSRSHVTVM